ncbi:hypothetical protein GCM10010082_07400 [Kushneria pakistanensis]|uniref:FimV N-terminal domain-containing protein n=1 Tax=Kushneria pakistanensis TaxID=1508770 RepID=A0ABQ3FCL8_9GAMM|nr:hypothetical protein [Kushneria pakistanensis]GHC18517.1 hypothetical protein GCM10010082_07400 [Kushneria pakistanensis]
MADWPCGLRLRDCLLTALLLSVSATAHAVGIATPQVMSGFNEPLKARVALLDTGALRAGDIRVSLADSERWQAMDIMRSADTDTLQLAVNGTPGHLYLDLQGSRALVTPWLDVVLTIRWPQGELTPQLTLLPATRASPSGDMATAGTSARRSTMNSIPAASAPVPSNTDRAGAPERSVREAPVQDNRRVAALEARLERLEQQLRTSQEAQTALMAGLESVRAQSLERQSTPDTAGMEALALSQQALETRLDQLEQTNVSASAAVSVSDTSDAISQPAVPLQEASLQEAAAVPEQSDVDRDNSFIWVYGLAALLLMSAGLWALVRRLQQRRYRLVSAAELSPLGEASLHSEEALVADKGSENQQVAVGTEQSAAWTAHRDHIDAICNEAEVFYRHGRRDHAITMLREGLEHYPNDFHLIRALAALEVGGAYDEISHDANDGQQQSAAAALIDETPALAPRWSLQPDAIHHEGLDAMQDIPLNIANDRGADFSPTPAIDFPRDWTLEEVAFESVDTDNERPNADRLSGHA